MYKYISVFNVIYSTIERFSFGPLQICFAEGLTLKMPAVICFPWHLLFPNQLKFTKPSDFLKLV